MSEPRVPPPPPVQGERCVECGAPLTPDGDCARTVAVLRAAIRRQRGATDAKS